MHRETAGARRRIDDIVIQRRIEHSHAHVDNVARREILSLFSLGCLDGQIFEGFVNDLQVGVEKLDILQKEPQTFR